MGRRRWLLAAALALLGLGLLAACGYLYFGRVLPMMGEGPDWAALWDQAAGLAEKAGQNLSRFWEQLMNKL